MLIKQHSGSYSTPTPHALRVCFTQSTKTLPVPRCKRDFDGSVLRRVDSRATWIACMTECLLLCNEAAWRRIIIEKRSTAKRGGPAAAPHDPKPLMLEYIADRLNTGPVLIAK